MSENRIPLLHFANVHFKILDFVAAAKVDYMKNWCWLFSLFSARKKKRVSKRKSMFSLLLSCQNIFLKKRLSACNIIQLIFFVTRFSGSTISLVMDWGCDLSEMVRSNISPKTCTKNQYQKYKPQKLVSVMILTIIQLARINPKRSWPDSIPTTPVPPTSMKERTATLWFMVFSEADDKFYGLFAPMVFHYIKKRETAALPSPFVLAPLLFYHPSSSLVSAAWFLHFDGKKVHPVNCAPFFWRW